MPWAPVLASLTLGDDERSRGLYRRGDGRPDGAGGLLLDPGGRVDLGTWFNAAPVAWWRRILGIDRVVLSAAGVGELTVFRADPGPAPAGRRGAEPRGPRRVTTVTLHGEHEIELPADDVTWYWVELHAAGRPGRLDALHWSVPAPPATSSPPEGPVGVSSPPEGPEGVSSPPEGPEGVTSPPGGATAAGGGSPAPRATVVVPTYGRERDALDQVRLLLAPACADLVGRVVLVDQARTVRSAPGAGEVMAAAGDRLLLVEQDNLGGSGGYARGMLESLAFPGDAVLLLDDDARIEPAGLRRMLTLGALAGRAGTPIILGTPLLSAEHPTELEALAEGVRRRDFRWGPADGLPGAVDVSVTNPAGWTFADPAARTDYTGWWGTLLPPGAVADLGLPAPYFLKWDDAEYGLRARRAGYRVATVPGTGVWHPTWAAKGTISTWAAWPLHRNRLATAAGYRAGRGVLGSSLAHQVKHVLSLQYDTADLWDAALAQFAAGPDWLAADPRTTRDRAQAVLDAAAQSSVAQSPGLPSRSRRRGRTVTDAAGALPFRAVRAVLGLVRPARAHHVVRADVGAFTWRTGFGRDAVVLDGSDRALVRDPARARAALTRTLRLHLQAARRWRTLRRGYARALPASRTAERWRAVIDGRGAGGGQAASAPAAPGPSVTTGAGPAGPSISAGAGAAGPTVTGRADAPGWSIVGRECGTGSPVTVEQAAPDGPSRWSRRSRVIRHRRK